jgi:hypothetical protein
MNLPDHGAIAGKLDFSKLTPAQLQAALPVLSTAELDLVLDAARQATQANLDAQARVAGMALALQTALQSAGFVMSIVARA